ncbi:MAG TPA: DinB family protein [Bryobacteraceae bacterium]|nr:DinB family protein [Bryobacteraceae bacterium]
MERIFLDFSAKKLRQLESRIQTCLERLSDEQIWMREAETQNAAGNLVLHLCGNVRQWILSAIGGQADTRTRDAEFAARGGITATELKERLAATVAEAASVIESLTDMRLRERVRVQGYELSVLEAIYHVIEHFAQHTGQIIFATKLLTQEDLGFYAHLRQAAHGQETP